MSASSSGDLVDALARLRPSEHVCTPYEQHEDRFVATASFLRLGLERGYRSVFIPEEGAGTILLAGMQSDGVDVGGALRSGALAIVEKDQAYLREGRFDPDRMIAWLRALVEDAVQRGFPTVHLAGEAVAILRSYPGIDRFAEYESKLNVFLRDQPMIVLCLYNHHRFPHDLVRQVLQTHPLVISGRTVCKNPFYMRPEEYLLPDWPEREVKWMIDTLVELQRAEDALRESRDRYRDLSRHLLEVQERERRSLARDLHDRIGQDMVALRLTLRAIGDECPACAPRSGEGVTVVDRMLQQVRKLALELRPSTLDDLGLSAAFRLLVEAHAQRAGYQAQVSVEPPDARFPADVETACFRIVQEALTNVDQHARARHVEVTVQADAREVRAVVRDDGVGFDVARHLGRSLGLVGMQERAAVAGGTVEIQSEPDRGTTVVARLPLA